MKDWSIKTCSSHGGYGIEVYLVNSITHTEILVPSDKLKVFGFYCPGPHLGIIGTTEGPDTQENQDITINEILTDHIYSIETGFEYWLLDDYMTSKYKVKSNIEKLSIFRVLKIVKDEYQEIIRYKKKLIEEERYFK